MTTPFDALTLALMNRSFQAAATFSPPIPINQTTLKFLVTSRILYLQMQNTSNVLRQRFRTSMAKANARTIPITESLDMHTETTGCILSYFHFIENLNQFGRVLRTRYHCSIPSYFRIRFFRNKVVEHWDEYLKVQMDGHGLIYFGDKIAIPYHYGSISKHQEASADRQIVEKEFNRLGIKLSDWEDKWYSDYSELMYKALEKIDLELHRIPNSLVNALFVYSLPTPICDVEAYCEQLTAELNMLKLS